MKLISLLIGNILRKRIRTSMTVLSLTIAFLLFTLVQALTDAFSGGVELAGLDRIVIDSKYSLTDNLPLSYVQKIRSLDGVDQVTNLSWFGGYYKTPQTSFATYPVDPTSYFEVFGDQNISADTLLRFKNNRISAVASEALASQYGWQIGDTIAITQDIFPQGNGSWDWHFEFAGTFQYPAGQLLLINYGYFNESVVDWAKNQVGWLVGRVSNPEQVEETIQAVDQMFENASFPTRSTSEDEYRRQFANQIGDVGAIGSMIVLAVFFTIVLVTGNTASQSYVEKVPDLAILKMLGFRDYTVVILVLSETCILCMVGAISGIAFALVLEPRLAADLIELVGRFDVTWQNSANALGLSLLLGVAIGVYPAWRAYRLTIVEALRRG